MTDNNKGVVNLSEKAALLTELWSPRVVGEVDDSYVKIAKVKGEFTWHDHQEDEFFLVLDGQLEIQLEGHTVTLNTGEFYVVPKGVSHSPVARETCTVMLFEKKTTAHTGAVKADMTRDLSEQLRPL
jgi:mannose-6-phosphate isomerase-like protein (cupin superfamily)